MVVDLKVDKKTEYQPFISTHIPEEFWKKAKTELHETEEKRISAVKQLREFALREKEMQNCRLTDEYLLQFLRARKFNVNRSLALLKKSWNFKKSHSKIFAGMVYDNMVKLIKSNTYSFLPTRDADGCAIYIIHLNNWNPSEVSFDHLVKAVVMFLYHTICDPLTQINGYKVIFDVHTSNFKHFFYCTPSNLWLLYNGTQECFPGRFKAIHIINNSLVFKAGWALFCPFMSDKFKTRMIFHDDSSTLKNYFPEEILPVDLGGKLQSHDSVAWLTNAFQKESLDKLIN